MIILLSVFVSEITYRIDSSLVSSDKRPNLLYKKIFIKMEVLLILED